MAAHKNITTVKNTLIKCHNDHDTEGGADKETMIRRRVNDEIVLNVLPTLLNHVEKYHGLCDRSESQKMKKKKISFSPHIIGVACAMIGTLDMSEEFSSDIFMLQIFIYLSLTVHRSNLLSSKGSTMIYTQKAHN